MAQVKYKLEFARTRSSHKINPLNCAIRNRMHSKVLSQMYVMHISNGFQANALH